MAVPPVFADRTLVAWSNPEGRPLHFLGLELLMGLGFLLTLRHALERRRDGDPQPLFRWLVILAYGVMMELIAFNFYQSYDHAQFTIQLYHRKLPLYITAVYVTLHYTGLEAVQRLRLPWWKEALLAGFSMCMLDIPFDTIGVDAGWWSWSRTDATVGVRWLGVPVTSYYWYLSFGATLASLCRASRGPVARGTLFTSLGLAPLVAASNIAAGIVAFLPFHGLVALGVPQGFVVAAHLALCLGLAAALRAPLAEPAPQPVRLLAGLLPAYFLLVLAMIRVSHGVPHAGAKLAIMVAAAAASNGIVRALPLVARSTTG